MAIKIIRHIVRFVFFQRLFSEVWRRTLTKWCQNVLFRLEQKHVTIYHHQIHLSRVLWKKYLKSVCPWNKVARRWYWKWCVRIPFWIEAFSKNFVGTELCYFQNVFLENFKRNLMAREVKQGFQTPLALITKFLTVRSNFQRYELWRKWNLLLKNIASWGGRR